MVRLLYFEVWNRRGRERGRERERERERMKERGGGGGGEVGTLTAHKNNLSF